MENQRPTKHKYIVVTNYFESRLQTPSESLDFWDTLSQR